MERTASLATAAKTAIKAPDSDIARTMDQMDPTFRTETAIRAATAEAKLQESNRNAELLVTVIKTSVKAICTTEKTCEYSRFVTAAVEAAIAKAEELNAMQYTKDEIERLGKELQAIELKTRPAAEILFLQPLERQVAELKSQLETTKSSLDAAEESLKATVVELEEKKKEVDELKKKKGKWIRSFQGVKEIADVAEKTSSTAEHMKTVTN